MKHTTACLAHLNKDGKEQSILDHLFGVAKRSSEFASKVGLNAQGELIGLLHDVGKYSDEFQRYLKSASGMINSDEDDYINAAGMRGKVDHATAGGQLIWNLLLDSNPGEEKEKTIAAQILSLCAFSHHSGLIDCLAPDGSDIFSARLEKSEEKAHCCETLNRLAPSLRVHISELLASPGIVTVLIAKLKEIYDPHQDSPITALFKQGLLVRFLFSCVTDADRLDTAGFENQEGSKLRNESNYVSWDKLIERLEDRLRTFEQKNEVDVLRAQIAEVCRNTADSPPGIYSLTVPTGGGKTLSSLRFALYHAKRHQLDRIIFVIPYTSIIDQNADEVKRILEDRDAEGKYTGRIVLEHHSNLTPDEETSQQKILSENWDAPVVFTTSVQLLECLFGSGTRNARRLHQLARSVIIFDEIQTIPVRCVHMFNNAMSFLTCTCGSTIVLCTATQPLLNGVDKRRGALNLHTDHEMMPDVGRLFTELRRVQTYDRRKPGGWTPQEIAELAFDELEKSGNTLVIVNTRKAAREIFKQSCLNHQSIEICHLSTTMCPAHRLDVLDRVRSFLDPESPKPIVCISTQLIEAGVDVDFGSVIRSVAGIDSIAQAAGRCNRHGLRKQGRVFIVNPDFEDLSKLYDIKIGQQKAARILDEFNDNPEYWQNDRLSPKVIAQYFRYYFYERASQMHYPVNDGEGVDSDLLSLLSVNQVAVANYKLHTKESPKIYFRQSFRSAARAFSVIDLPTKGIIIPYGDGKNIISELCCSYDIHRQYDLLRRAQRYSVNIFPWEFRQLIRCGVIHEVQNGTGVYYLISDTNYNEKFGLDISTCPFFQV